MIMSGPLCEDETGREACLLCLLEELGFVSSVLIPDRAHTIEGGQKYAEGFGYSTKRLGT